MTIYHKLSSSSASGPFIDAHANLTTAVNRDLCTLSTCALPQAFHASPDSKVTPLKGGGFLIQSERQSVVFTPGRTPPIISLTPYNDIPVLVHDGCIYLAQSSIDSTSCAYQFSRIDIMPSGISETMVCPLPKDTQWITMSDTDIFAVTSDQKLYSCKKTKTDDGAPIYLRRLPCQRRKDSIDTNEKATLDIAVLKGSRTLCAISHEAVYLIDCNAPKAAAKSCSCSTFGRYMGHHHMGTTLVLQFESKTLFIDGDSATDIQKYSPLSFFKTYHDGRTIYASTVSLNVKHAKGKHNHMVDMCADGSLAGRYASYLRQGKVHVINLQAPSEPRDPFTHSTAVKSHTLFQIPTGKDIHQTYVASAASDIRIWDIYDGHLYKIPCPLDVRKLWFDQGKLYALGVDKDSRDPKIFVVDYTQPSDSHYAFVNAAKAAKEASTVLQEGASLALQAGREATSWLVGVVSKALR